MTNTNTTTTTFQAFQEVHHNDLRALSESHPNAMAPAILHGYLTGVALGPAAILKKPWVHEALGLGDGQPIPHETQKRIELLVDRLSSSSLDGQLFSEQAIPALSNGKSVVLEQWCQGFLRAYKLVESSWQKRLHAEAQLQQTVNLFRAVVSPEQAPKLLPQWSTNATDSLVQLRKKTQQTIHELAQMIPFEELEEEPIPA